MTREHIWSDSVLRVFEPDAPITFDEKRGIVHDADPVLKDLCEDCNRGLSPADKEAKRFADAHCTREIPDGEDLIFDATLLRLWATKTAANMERSNAPRGNDWWKDHVKALRLQDPVPERVEVLFAAWRDLNPASEFIGVKALDAQSVVLGNRSGPGRSSIFSRG